MARSILIRFFIICIAGMAAIVMASAQGLVDKRDRTADNLLVLQQEIFLSEQRKKELAEEINKLAKDRSTLNRKLIETTGNSRRLEKRITRTEDRLNSLEAEQLQVRGYLSGKKELLAEVLGALQRMGRKPPPALLVTPEDALSSVRSAILLGSVVPEVRAETDILLSQLQDLSRISAEIEAQRVALMEDFQGLAQEEERLNLLIAEKRALSGRTQAELADESAKAAELAAKATSLNDLIEQIETEIETVRLAEEEARIAEEERKRVEEERATALAALQNDSPFSDSSRRSPAMSFSATEGLLPLPVEGKMIAGFGSDDGAGDTTSGLSLETRPASRVISPSDGWILYAGPFRSYGQLLIINAGEGYHIVLAGMEGIDVQPGQFVLLGEPIGSMGSQRIASTGLVDVSTTKPILYVEFRKDGKSIDPTPWWSVNEIERASNDS